MTTDKLRRKPRVSTPRMSVETANRVARFKLDARRMVVAVQTQPAYLAGSIGDQDWDLDVRKKSVAGPVNMVNNVPGLKVDPAWNATILKNHLKTWCTQIARLCMARGPGYAVVVFDLDDTLITDQWQAIGPVVKVFNDMVSTPILGDLLVKWGLASMTGSDKCWLLPRVVTARTYSIEGVVHCFDAMTDAGIMLPIGQWLTMLPVQ
jgi:hypothetical protein